MSSWSFGQRVIKNQTRTVNTGSQVSDAFTPSTLPPQFLTLSSWGPVAAVVARASRADLPPAGIGPALQQAGRIYVMNVCLPVVRTA